MRHAWQELKVPQTRQEALLPGGGIRLFDGRKRPASAPPGIINGVPLSLTFTISIFRLPDVT
jgi:hypothetical protein